MDWRTNFNIDSALRNRAEGRIDLRIAEGRVNGLKEYGPDFVGDPLEHAFEEAVDLALYLATELERRAAAP